MGWLERCYETYEKNLTEVGKSAMHGDKEAPMLLPVAHTTQKVQAEISLSAEGSFLSARVVRPDEATTVIPCTEGSSSRTSGPVPHPLVDKLQYIAGDYTAYGGKKKSEYRAYAEQLRAWCGSPFRNENVRAVLAYVEKGTVIADLINARVLVTGSDGKLVTDWKGYEGEPPQISGVLADETECFVRWRVNGAALHDDWDVWQSWSDYYTSGFSSRGICYVTGREMPLSQLSPYKIRHAGDRSKLISSNDAINFTFRGERFADAGQALRIGYDTTQKAHSALRWLIGKQGIANGGQTILVWGTENEDLPPVTGDSVSFAGEDDLEDELDGTEGSYVDTTRTAFAELFARKAQGYAAELGDHSKISVMILDSATPGRMSVKYYRELSRSLLIGNILNWHKTFTWQHEYRKIQTEKDGKRKDIIISFYGAPSPYDIAKAAYGEKANEKLVSQTVERVLPCITEGKPLPRDIMLSAVRRASNSAALEYWEARKVRSIACALVRGHHKRNFEEEYTMAVNESCKDRSYLFGRILACADYIEFCAQNAGDVKAAERRPTNAQRMEVVFTQRPAKTCKLLRKQLVPYINRLIKNGQTLAGVREMEELLAGMPIGDFSDKPLNELYLLGYASQRQEFFTSRKDKNAGDGENNE